MEKIPKLKTIEEIREFWEKHDFTEFVHDTVEAQVKFIRPQKTQVTFRLDSQDVKN